MPLLFVIMLWMSSFAIAKAEEAGDPCCWYDHHESVCWKGVLHGERTLYCSGHIKEGEQGFSESNRVACQLDMPSDDATLDGFKDCKYKLEAIKKFQDE